MAYGPQVLTSSLTTKEIKRLVRLLVAGRLSYEDLTQQIFGDKSWIELVDRYGDLRRLNRGQVSQETLNVLSADRFDSSLFDRERSAVAVSPLLSGRMKYIGERCSSDSGASPTVVTQHGVYQLNVDSAVFTEAAFVGYLAVTLNTETIHLYDGWPNTESMIEWLCGMCLSSVAGTAHPYDELGRATTRWVSHELAALTFEAESKFGAPQGLFKEFAKPHSAGVSRSARGGAMLAALSCDAANDRLTWRAFTGGPRNGS